MTVYPGGTAAFNVTAAGATSYQWRFNGADIANGTNSTVQISNAQSNNSGYYLVVAKNATGWVPSQMAWLAVVGSNGIVPFSNVANTNSYNGLGQAVAAPPSSSSFPINGSAQIMAGPALDQMTLLAGSANKARVTNGWFNPTQLVSDGPNFYTTNKMFLLPTVAAGQAAYYSVYIAYTSNSTVYTQQSTVISLIAGGNGAAIPSLAGLLFPYWIEWPQDPWTSGRSPTNQVRVLGETFSLTNYFGANTDLGLPKFQWRKDGVKLGSLQSFVRPYPSAPFANATAVLAVTNAQPSDAGVYDLDVRGNLWFISDKIYVSIQTTNGRGVLQKPKLVGGNLTCDVVGAIGRNYMVQCSTNLSNWLDLMTLSNATGTVTFTNALGANSVRFYRTVLLP